MIYRIVGWQKYSETRKKNIQIEKYFFVIWGHCFKATVLIHSRTFVFLKTPWFIKFCNKLGEENNICATI